MNDPRAVGTGGRRRADVRRFAMADPGDVSGLRAAIDAGEIDPAAILAVIGKTHGNGLVNDYTRGYLRLSLAHLIAARTGRSAEAVMEATPFIFSGGVEGVLSPHYVVLSATDAIEAGEAPSLAIGLAFTPDLMPEDIGRQRQIDLTAEAVERAMDQGGMAPDDVRFVQVKGPAFGSADIQAAAQRGRPCVQCEPGKLMAYGRAASALGIARALGEIPFEAATAAALLQDFGLWSGRASCSAGSEVRANEIVVLGLSDAWTGPLTIGTRTMVDALDLGALVQLAEDLGLKPAPQVAAADAARIRACFVKCEPQRDGLIRGRAHTMLNDGDIDAQRHIRGAVGALVAGVLNDTALFVSGGAEHQGSDGGGLVCLIIEQPPAPGHPQS
ncbi:MAG: ring-opening amidohydrolase [Ancalomicrobiaceae bacterium]|nr:ring-opening amidohydrolase [Ancalomicrobiaceae bacterium]